MIAPLTDRASAAIPPAITVSSPQEGQALNNSSPVIAGVTEASLKVDIYIDNVWKGSVNADVYGNWTLGVGSIPEGTHSLYAKATDTTGNIGTSSTVTFEIDVTPPTVIITRPQNGGYTNIPSVEGQTEPGLPVTVHVYDKQVTVTADVAGYWLYYDPYLPERDHAVYATAVDKAGNPGTSATNNFTLDMTRPVVLPILYPAPDITQASSDISAKVYIVDKSPLDPARLTSALVLLESVSSVSGTVYDAVYGSVYTTVYDPVYDPAYTTVSGAVYSSVYSDVYGNPYYEITFIPAVLLKPGVKYTASVNPALTDAAGNPVFSRTWSFTITVGQLIENPHGNYLNNVNICNNCHSVHWAGSPKLVSGNPSQKPIDNYCNACHDGTAAPLPGNWSAQNKHNYLISLDGTKGVSACTACHNPHLPWKEENPNFLQDYFYYAHNSPTNPFLPNSSEEALCETCHNVNIRDDARVLYERYQYRKWHTSTGVYDDYNLCLRCHDGRNAVNIAVYYNDGASRHILSAKDGSPLNGHIACADCHNTHGSNNLKLLKDRLGHNKVQKFQTPAAQWDAATERAFCTGCHNNQTELYGNVAGFVYGISGHEATSIEFCHKCHGGSPQAAAHAPK